jgi:uncharacterized protein
MGNKYLEIAATDSVKRVQQRLGSRATYARREGGPTIHQQLGSEEISFIEAQDTFFLASVSETGWPYVQHRGGPKGFVTVLDQSTIGFPEFSGNRQYLSFGNILQDPRVSLFFLDFRRQERLKIFGYATLAERAENPDLLRRLETENLPSKAERAIVIQIEAFDWNCSQYIVPRFSEDEVRDLLQPFKQRIDELETRIQNQESRTGNPSVTAPRMPTAANS